MRRVVVTGMGIVSCLGNLPETVARALRDGRSGIRAMSEFAAHGLRSQVAGVPEIDLDAAIDRKLRRFMGDAAAYACAAMRSAIDDAGLTLEHIRHPRTGVIAGGGGMLVLEEYEHAVRRGANIHAELLGYGVTSDGADMVMPGGDGAARSMRMALATADRPVDYLNTHGTATPLGDIAELNAVRDVFGDAVPQLSSTKSLSGHALGAAGVHEAIYSMLMLEQGFVAGSANIDELDARAATFPIVRESQPARLATVMSNSFGFGGTNASLLFSAV
jgi:3-oxoacyl-(acyl-carrier-protein) synthase